MQSRELNDVPCWMWLIISLHVSSWGVEVALDREKTWGQRWNCHLIFDSQSTEGMNMNIHGELDKTQSAEKACVAYFNLFVACLLVSVTGLSLQTNNSNRNSININERVEPIPHGVQRRRSVQFPSRTTDTDVVQLLSVRVNLSQLPINLQTPSLPFLSSQTMFVD